ncbi:MAG TPA: sulfite exporter TauE/SafE family protein [Burkholderiales bacterium]|nr:sulfite exporter TauE/SafE family protein [Burkholderiales bacterium]
MPDTTLLAVFFAGLLGGGHCAAMCGGIVGALAGGRGGRPGLQLAYNAGRIGSYAVAGVLAGALGGLAVVRGMLPLQLVLYAAANVLLVLMGAYVAGWTSLVTRLEGLGRHLWHRISPLTRRLLPADTVPRALGLGALWGWLPCGLTYSVLAIALVSGGPRQGATLMAAFGLGTAPNLLLAGLLLQRVQPWMRHPAIRVAAGCTVAAFGVAGLLHVAWLGDQLRRGVACLT